MNRMLVWLLVGSGVWCADGPTGDAVWRADGSPRDGVWWSGIAGFGGQKVHETIHWNRSSRGGTNSFDEPRQEDSLLFVWWNLHNLFDTVENSGPRDRDFLPKGPYKWDSKRYFTKLYAVGRGLAAAAGGRIPDAIGV